MFTICLIEDEEDLRDILSVYLTKADYHVITCGTLKEAKLHLFDKVDLWIVDLMLPDGSGFEIMKEIKKQQNPKIIVISARGDSIDRVLGFEMGCDDYIAKPFMPQELIFRIEKLCTKTNESDILNFETYQVDFTKRTIIHQGTIVSLTSKEFDLVAYLVKNRGLALSREQIIQHAWNDDFIGTDRIVDNFIKKLRSKIPFMKIETIYGYGYRFIV